jgi:hypothetical protein
VKDNPYFGDTGMARLTRGLAISNYIKKVVLSEANIGDEGAFQLTGTQC